MPAYTITPDDVLFFRDGRPMATAGGHGARWPEPSVIFDALHAALHRGFPDKPQRWEHRHRYGRSSARDMTCDRTQRFGSLATAGPFPARAGTGWLFPRPQDVTTSPSKETWLLQPLAARDPSNLSDLSNLPSPLKYPLPSFAPPSKDEPLPWWTKAAIEAYLRGEPLSPAQRWEFDDDDLFAREWHIGIAIDPATQTTGHGDAAGKIYAAQYLRLREGVTLGIHATMPMKNDQPAQLVERITELFPATHILIVGGQQRACQVEEIRQNNQPIALDTLLPVSPRITGNRVKWLLLSPAVFPVIQADDNKHISPHPGGWLPNWIAPEDNFKVRQGDQIIEVEKGRVLLKNEPHRQPGESREAWRERIRRAPFLDCRLVAARIPKPIVITGWTEAIHLKDTPWQREHGPRPTLLAVPAGAVYYFEGPDAPQLAEALSWHGAAPNPSDSSSQTGITTIRNRRSTLLGEKGFGLGVCAPWEFYPSDPSDRPNPSDHSKQTTP